MPQISPMNWILVILLLMLLNALTSSSLKNALSGSPNSKTIKSMKPQVKW